MRKLRKARTRSEKNRSDSLIAAELLERRYAFTATPLLDQFTSAAMEAVARGELTSERWIVHKLGNNEFSSEGSCQRLTNFGGNAGWHADPIGTSFFRLQTSGIDSSHVVDWARNNHEHFLIEPDLPIQVQKTPNDPSLWRLYGLNNYGQSGGTTDADLDAPEAWDITTGSRDVVIGVIDSGVDINHPDLAANIWVNPGETPNNGIDDDGNGFIDDVNGWDFHDNDNTPNDGNGHGTHVAGTIGAVGNNNSGIAGVNWEVSILPLRFLGDDGSGWTSDAVAAVNYATMLKRDFGINVAATNNSWGGGGYSRTLDRAIESANDQGIMFVAAAGNQGSNNDTNPSYPTNYDAPNVISVAALNRNDNLASFSNYGTTTVDVGAPGVSIYSTLPGNSYGSFSGTSMAAPHVTGIVGLLNAAKPGISITEVTNAILGTVDTVQSLQGKTVSGGRVNAAAALTSILGESPTIDPLNDLIMDSDQTKTVPVLANDADGDVRLEFSLSVFSGKTAPATVSLTGSTLTITASNDRSGLFTIEVTARDTDSNTATESFQVEVLNELESNGSVILGEDVADKLYANEFSIHDPIGKHISTSHYDGWQTLAVETIDGVNTILWEYTPTGRLHYWRTDASWNWQSSIGKHFDGSTEYYDAEIDFEIDINQDGTIGKPITTDLQDFPPEVLPGTSVVNLPVGYETSGLTWHQGLEKIFSVSDEGVVSMMNRDGTELVHWNIGGDFEAITVADHTSNFVYIGIENPDSVIEFDVSSGQITRTFSLTDWMTGPSNLGLEALTFVPDATHPEGGVFYAGLQSTGEVFRFGLSIKSSSTLSSVTFINTLVIEGSHTDLADLSYDPSSDRILALYDSLDRIKVIEKDGELRTQWVAPGTEQEAILYVSGELFIGEDFGGSARGTITQFSPFTSIVA